MEKTYFEVLHVGGICNSKSKNFVSLSVWSYYFLIVFFKTIILRNIVTESKIQGKAFEVPVFVASLTEPLSLSVSDYDRKIKENSHSQ